MHYDIENIKRNFKRSHSNQGFNDADGHLVTVDFSVDGNFRLSRSPQGRKWTVDQNEIV